MYRSTPSQMHIVRTVLVMMLVAAFAFAVATPALAKSMSRKQVIATIKSVAKSEHLSNADIKALLKIAKMESSFRPTARNHSCKGLFQLKTRFPKSKWANVVWNTKKAIRYIKHRYGNERAALRFHYAHGWY